MWEKVVLNLVSNAYKFTLEGEITVSLRWLGDSVELSVRDTGTGIPEAEAARVFDRFHRVEGAKGRTHEGSGIGLALVKELVKLHGGSVTLESVLGRGSTFRVSLPTGRAHLPAANVDDVPSYELATTGPSAFVGEAGQWSPPTSPSPGRSTTPRGADSLSPREGVSDSVRGRVLLVDDNADMRASVRRTLEPGLAVSAFSDGQSALEAARVRPPDVVVADVMMPGLDGFGLLRALQEDPRTAHVPVILLSARAGEEATVEGLAAGAADYLVKPFSARALRARVDSAVKAAQAKTEREHLLRELRAGRHRLENLIERAPAIICVLRGPDHVYEMVNPHCQRLSGVGRPLLGLPVAQALPELVSQGFITLLDTVYRTGEPFVGSEIPARFDRSGSGELEDAFMNFIYQARRNARGEVEGIDCFGFDVTDQVTARRIAESLSAELTIANQQKDEFLAMLAHELRNPMSAISLALSMLERTNGDTAKTAQYYATARRQMGNLVRLVDDLLDLSRITRGNVELRLERVDLSVLLQNAVTVARIAIEARGHELSVTLAPETLSLDADATRLEQVVVNLLTNAAKYTEPGGRVSVGLAKDDSRGEPEAVLTVRDSGRGIPAAMLNQVFDMFVQVAPTIDRRMGGLGIGLTLVKRLVELHHGTVEARSEGPGKGSEFVVRLPLTARVTPLPSTPAPVQAQAFTPRRILIVEDSEDVRENLKAYLEDSGHEVLVAVDGLEGVRTAIELRPDVSLVDVGLPGIDGYELARRVRVDSGGRNLYLVALTGYGGPDAKAKALAAGFDVHLTKPINVDELSDVVGRARVSPHVASANLD